MKDPFAITVHGQNVTAVRPQSNTLGFCTHEEHVDAYLDESPRIAPRVVELDVDGILSRDGLSQQARRNERTDQARDCCGRQGGRIPDDARSDN
jgi:hypothetical protein